MTIDEAIIYCEARAEAGCSEDAGADRQLAEWLRDLKILGEKQIPKKPALKGDGYDDEGRMIYDTWICPCCSESYEVDYDRYDYCPNCGQKLDLSEVN